MNGVEELNRCWWCGDDPLYVKYHDEEWGVETHGDERLFELLTLEGAQAGLSWITVLRRRQGYRRVFAEFNPAVVANFDDECIEVICRDEGVIRHRQKIYSVVNNAQRIVDLSPDMTFDELVWELGTQDPDTKVAAQQMSKELRRRGFQFIGETICHSLMQASGMVNGHAKDCFRYEELQLLFNSR